MNNKFIKWLGGFRRKYYVYPLATQSDLNGINLEVKEYIFEDIIRDMNLLNSGNIDMAVNSFTAEIYDNENIKSIVEINDKSLSHIKIYYEHETYSNNREISILGTIFSIGLDNKLWKFVVSGNILYNSISDKRELKYVKILVKYINAVIDELQLSNMCKQRVYIKSPEAFNKSYTEKFYSAVTTYCDTDSSGNYGYKFDDSECIANKLVLKNSLKPIDELIENSFISDSIERVSDVDYKDKINASVILENGRNSVIRIGDIVKDTMYKHNHIK